MRVSTVQLVIVCVTVLLLAVTAAVAHVATATAREAAATPPAAPVRTGRRVTIHTKEPDDRTIYGLLVADFPDRLSLENAEFVNAAGKHALPGRIDVATADISWVDVHAPIAHFAPDLTGSEA
jgi:hypothetical protein